MPYKDNRMNEFVNDARELIGQMKAQYEINKGQIESINKELERQTEINQRYFEMVTGTLRAFRTIAITMTSLILIPAVIGGFTLDKRVSKNEEIISKQDHAERTEVINSFDVIINENGDVFESMGLPTNEVIKYDNRVRDGVKRAMGDVSRGVQPIEK